MRHLKNKTRQAGPFSIGLSIGGAAGAVYFLAWLLVFGRKLLA